MKYYHLIEKFAASFNRTPQEIICSPVGPDLIFDQTVARGGFISPATDKYVYVVLSKRSDNELHLHSVQNKESFNVSISGIRHVHGWPAYILRVADELIKKGFQIRGFNILLDGQAITRPENSFSASIECATVFGLNEIFSLRMGRMDMVDIVQKAKYSPENPAPDIKPEIRSGITQIIIGTHCLQEKEITQRPQ